MLSRNDGPTASTSPRRGGDGAVGIFLGWRGIEAIFTEPRSIARPFGIHPRVDNKGSRARGRGFGPLGGSKKCPEASGISRIPREDPRQKYALGCISADIMGQLGVFASRPVGVSPGGETVASLENLRGFCPQIPGCDRDMECGACDKTPLAKTRCGRPEDEQKMRLRKVPSWAN